MTAHVPTASCDTVTVCPATTTAPWRAAPAFACTANFALPLPFPVVAPTGVMNVALLDALHAQPAVVVTLIVSSEVAAATGPDGAPLTVN